MEREHWERLHRPRVLNNNISLLSGRAIRWTSSIKESTTPYKMLDLNLEYEPIRKLERWHLFTKNRLAVATYVVPALFD